MKRLFFIGLCLCFNFCISQTVNQNLTLSDAALELTKQKVTYDPSYFSISYPNGDVPENKGVCSDY